MKFLYAFIFIIFSTFNFSETCIKSKWGEDDEIGNANLINSESVLKASKLITKGKTYSLGLIIDKDTPAYPPRSIELTIVQPFQQYGAGEDVYPNLAANDDIFNGWFGVGSQIDGLGHIGSPEGIFYNCFDGKDFAQITGLTKLGIEKIPPLVARGVLINMAEFFQVPYLDMGDTFDLEDVKKAMNNQKISVKKGDVVLFHTGWTEAKLLSEPKEWGAGAPGMMPDVALFLAEKEVIAVGADTWSLDVVPVMDEREPFPVHPILLKDNGIYILEAMNTGELAEDKVNEFLFILGPAKVRGAVQMIVNPIAIR